MECLAICAIHRGARDRTRRSPRLRLRGVVKKAFEESPPPRLTSKAAFEPGGRVLEGKKHTETFILDSMVSIDVFLGAANYTPPKKSGSRDVFL